MISSEKSRRRGSEQIGVDDRSCSTFVALASVDYLANIEAVLEDMGEQPDHGPVRLGTRPDPAPREILGQQTDRAESQIAGREVSLESFYRFRFGAVNGLPDIQRGGRHFYVANAELTEGMDDRVDDDRRRRRRCAFAS